MTKPRVVITDFINDDLAAEKDVLGPGIDIAALNADNEEALAGRVETASVVLSYGFFKISRASIQLLRDCRLIIRCGVGYDNIDIAFAREKGIPVANVPDYATEEVADSAIGMMLSLTRGIHLLNSRLRAKEGSWSYTLAAPLTRLRGNTLGIIGLGRIGTATALRAKALGLDVVFYDPYKPTGYDRTLGIRQTPDLDALLEQSLILSLHCPLTTETRNLIDARKLRLLPKGAFLINTARGAIVDNSAIPEALESGKLAGAGIDVLETEPPPDNHPLFAAWRNPRHPAHHRVILNPHSAFYSEDSLLELRKKGARTALQALSGKPVPNIVN